jgi:hypothetical protein
MAIASSNPEGEVQKQILAAAEYIPVPVMPLPQSLYSEVLDFIGRMTIVATDDNLKAEAKRLAAKLLLFKPAPDSTKNQAEITAEEKRKRDRRLTKKNGQPLGGGAGNPPTSPTSEHVQRFEPTSHAGAEIIQGDNNSVAEPGPETPEVEPSNNAPRARRRLNLGDVHAMAAPQHSEVDRVIPEQPNEVGSAPAENLVEDNSPGPLQGSAAQHGETTCTQLVPGKKYQVRPAPSGGYGIYEARSTALMQWHEEEDDARDAIDHVSASVLVA